MGKIAFLFAGQGAQYSGMGKSLYDLGGKSAEIFDLAEKQKDNIKDLCFSGTAEALSDTKNTQSCVFTVDLAAAYALADRGVVPSGVAGFSLGELAALTFAECFTDEAGISLVLERGRLMAEDAETNAGGMAAVLKLSNQQVEKLCGEFNQMYPVNYNCEGQLVVAGALGEIDLFCDKVKENRGLAKRLAVSGAFHSPFMAEAAANFKARLTRLNKSELTAPKIPVYANLTSSEYSNEKEAFIETLSNQICNPVLWESSVSNMIKDGYDTFIEVGAGKTLSGLVKRITKACGLTDTITICNVEDEASLQETLTTLNTLTIN